MPDEDARWMSYQALAEARGTSKHAAQVLVRRRKWPRQTSNEGHVLVLVPPEWATAYEGAQDKGAKSPLNAEPRAPNGATHAVTVLEQALEALREAHAMERCALQGQIAELRTAATRADSAAQEAQQRAREMEAAEAARRARGRWARLRAAWREG
jgi:hypothetical protein